MPPKKKGGNSSRRGAKPQPGPPAPAEGGDELDGPAPADSSPPSRLGDPREADNSGVDTEDFSGQSAPKPKKARNGPHQGRKPTTDATPESAKARSAHQQNVSRNFAFVEVKVATGFPPNTDDVLSHLSAMSSQEETLDIIANEHGPEVKKSFRQMTSTHVRTLKNRAMERNRQMERFIVQHISKAIDSLLYSNAEDQVIIETAQGVVDNVLIRGAAWYWDHRYGGHLSAHYPDLEKVVVGGRLEHEKFKVDYVRQRLLESLRVLEEIIETDHHRRIVLNVHLPSAVYQDLEWATQEFSAQAQYEPRKRQGDPLDNLVSTKKSRSFSSASASASGSQSVDVSHGSKDQAGKLEPNDPNPAPARAKTQQQRPNCSIWCRPQVISNVWLLCASVLRQFFVFACCVDGNVCYSFFFS